MWKLSTDTSWTLRSVSLPPPEAMSERTAGASGSCGTASVELGRALRVHTTTDLDAGARAHWSAKSAPRRSDHRSSSSVKHTHSGGAPVASARRTSSRKCSNWLIALGCATCSSGCCLAASVKTARTLASAAGDADQLTCSGIGCGDCVRAEASVSANTSARRAVDVWLARKHTSAGRRAAAASSAGTVAAAVRPALAAGAAAVARGASAPPRAARRARQLHREPDDAHEHGRASCAIMWHGLAKFAGGKSERKQIRNAKPCHFASLHCARTVPWISSSNSARYVLMRSTKRSADARSRFARTTFGLAAAAAKRSGVAVAQKRPIINRP
eukprot:scaffold10125_cov71-Phaeocystis_antarctica.AAC.2